MSDKLTLAPEDYVLDVAGIEDINFIVNSWAASENTERRPLGVSEATAKVGMRERIAVLLQKHKAAVLRPTEAYAARTGTPYKPTDLLGFAVYGWDVSTQLPCLHFVYIKGAFRGNGLARILLTEAASISPGTFAWCTHMRRWLVPVAERYGLEYNPYLLERRK